MIRRYITCIVVSLVTLIFCLILPAPAYSFPSIHEPPLLESNLALLGSSTQITLKNADRLVVAGEVLFSPWELATALAWSPDGEIFAVAAGEQIHLLHVREWRVIATYSTGALTHSLAFSQDGNWLAAGSRDGQVRCWFQPLLSYLETSENQPSIIFQAHKKGVNDLAFSPDGTVLASGGNDAVARFWDLNTSQVLGLMIGGTFAVPSISFSPDGAVLAVANGEMIRLRQVGSERILGSFQADAPLFSLAYSPDGAWLAAGDTRNQILLWKPEQAFRTGQENYPDPIRLLAHAGSVGTYRSLIWDITFSPDSHLLASAGGDNSIRLWDFQNTFLIATLRGHTSGVTSVKFNNQSNSLASSGLDGRVLLWKIETDE